MLILRYVCEQSGLEVEMDMEMNELALNIITATTFGVSNKGESVI